MNPRPFRFRTDRDPRGTDQTRRRWQARYSHSGGWSLFEIAIDLEGVTCTFLRVGGADYRPLLLDLAQTLIGEAVALPELPEPAARLSLDANLVGLKMLRATASAAEAGAAPTGPYRPDPNGDWLVVRAYVPDGTESFLLGVSDRVGTGEIVTPDTGSGEAVVRTLSRVFA